MNIAIADSTKRTENISTIIKSNKSNSIIIFVITFANQTDQKKAMTINNILALKNK